MHLPRETICVVGLGYVGLPLALALSKHYDVVGIDTDSTRLTELKSGIDSSGEVSTHELVSASRLTISSTISDAKHCTVYIITVSTPVFDNQRPNLTILQSATTDVASVMNEGDMVIFESTVCPGTTESFCLPILEKISLLRVNTDFDLGYSPERISPSDKGLTHAIKIIAASNENALCRTRRIYESIIPSGLHEAASIKIAEAAKLTENIQRDVNIAVTNELAMLFDQMGINSTAVFDAAATKWNFSRFYPGLVGGHCIGVDSYYLIDYADKNNHNASVLRAARQVNNTVPNYVATIALNALEQRRQNRLVEGSTVLILGYSFKQNCADVRNTLVEPLRQLLLQVGCLVTVCDPVADAQRAMSEYGVEVEKNMDEVLSKKYDMIVFAVAHEEFKSIPKSALEETYVIDIKGIAARADWVL